MTITVKLDPELEAKVRARLGEGVTLSEYVRQALIEKMQTEDGARSPYELWRSVFDGYGSGESDRSTRIKDIVRDKIDAKRRSR